MLATAIVAVSKPALLDIQAQAANESGDQADNSLVRSHSPILGREDAAGDDCGVFRSSL